MSENPNELIDPITWFKNNDEQPTTTLQPSTFIYKEAWSFNSKICKNPKLHRIELGSSDDKSINDYLESLICELGNTCGNDCGSLFLSHTMFYIRKQGTVKLTFSAVERNDTCEINFQRKCKQCDANDEKLQAIPRNFMDFSFFKWLENFFIDGKSKTAECGHEYYKSAQLIFALGKINFSFEFVNANVAELTSPTNTINKEYYSRLKQSCYEKLKDSGQSVLENLLNDTKDMINRLMFEDEDEKEDLEEESWASLRDEVKELQKMIEGAMVELMGLDISNIQNFLHVENHRRLTFLACCHAKVIMETLKERINLQFNKNKKQKFPRSRSNSRATQGECLENDSFALSRASVAANRWLHAEYIQSSDPLLSTPYWNTLQEGNLALPVSSGYMHIPVYDIDLLSVITYSLNSSEYYHEVVSPALYSDDQKKHIENELLNYNPWHFKLKFSNFEEFDIPDLASRDDLKRVYGDCISFRVKAYFAKQFHSIREYSYGSDEDFLLSISKSKPIHGQLGKSKATFSVSHDGKYILKIIDRKEINMFRGVAQNYFRHLCKNFFHQMPSRLVRTIGAYQITVRNHHTGKSVKEYAFIFENLGYQMPEKPFVYDLKGTQNKRRYVKPGDTRTKMDLNFLEDFNCIPFIIPKEAKKFFDVAIWNDTLFLSKQNIVDYSLLVMISSDKSIIRAGIIDYFEQYTFERSVESKYKKVVGIGLPTIIHPKIYKARFRKALIQGYFIFFDD
ncbi:unnamed protein product [Blepharisma stoltei]|uniref:PIPK domain-containing protein n=1 Tax=Blepharisma stoltei TaxID=1481888 RepID=A0AAU9K488_9CILI|nr:unnamed protein product [Blepharisma stoltei]